MRLEARAVEILGYSSELVDSGFGKRDAVVGQGDPDARGEQLGSVKTIVGELCKDESQRDEELCRTVVRECFESADYVEGRTAFMEKRRPRFTGS